MDILFICSFMDGGPHGIYYVEMKNGRKLFRPPRNHMIGYRIGAVYI